MTLTLSHPGSNRHRVGRGVAASAAVALVAFGGYQVASTIGGDEAPAPAVVETVDPAAVGIGADPNVVWPEFGGLPATPAVIDPTLVWPETGGLPALPTGEANPGGGAHPGSLVR